MTPHEFIAKWKISKLKESASGQEHFLDLCELIDHPKPAKADPKGTSFTFERGVKKEAGGQGFADVWKKGCFGWEYKGKRKDLADAYRQLSQYREALENPPLLIVCDLNRFEIHTNFTGKVKEVHAFDLDGLADETNVQKLRWAFEDPYKLQPNKSQSQVTEEIAARFTILADRLRVQKYEPHRVARFLMKMMFCMFAEDIDLLPRGLFKRIVENVKGDSKKLTKQLGNLFDCMATGKDFGSDEILHFNGGLFSDADSLELDSYEIGLLHASAAADWSQVEPSIFGTLFERMLDPAKRAQIGAHYTSEEDIRTLVEPVVMAPLRKEWADVKAKADKLAGKNQTQFRKTVETFLKRLDDVTVLDPACGSGNFLYVTIKLLLDLEKEVLTYLNAHEKGQQRFPGVRPTQLRGIEINPYAQELAQVVIWIGYLQWKKENGFSEKSTPVLDPMENIECRDAILDLSDPENPKEPEWPEAEFIVGNPPFLGYSPLRKACGHEYTDALYKYYGDRLSNQSDLCVYWFEKSRAVIESGRTKRVGLLATQAIRGGKNREVLQRIADSGGIFFAISDKEWILDGANVHISMIGFDNGADKTHVLNGRHIDSINSNLTSVADITQAKVISENRNIAFTGGFKFGSFDISDQFAIDLLNQPTVGSKPNSDVVRPWINALDVLRRRPPVWIIDFGENMPEEVSATYDGPFDYVRLHVKPERDIMRRERRRIRWWLHGEPSINLRRALVTCERYLATPYVSKHRVFVWVPEVVQVDHQLSAVSREDNCTFGILHSRFHELWALRLGSRMEDRPRYTPSTCFNTFPFPNPNKKQEAAIAAAAKELDTLRNEWLNPEMWTRTEVLGFPGSVDGPWKRYVEKPNAKGIGTVKYPRIVPKDEACAAKLKKRTLTNLYNERPTWLANAHRVLDEAVAAAYGWPVDLSDDELLAKLLALNLERAK